MSLKAEIDWYHVGFTPGAAAPDFVGTGVDVTDLVRVDNSGGAHFQAKYGRDQSTAFAPLVSGSGNLVLDNKDRRFSPRNASSPLFGNIKPSRPARIGRTITSVPTDVPGLALWWRASDLSGLANGAAVTTWASVVGSSNATQGTGANQPTKQTVNGKTTVRFDGTNDFMSLGGDALTVTQNKAAVSIFVRAKVTGASAVGRLIYLSVGTLTTAGRIFLGLDATNLLFTGGRRLDADAVQNVIGAAPGSTEIRTMTGVLDYANNDAFLYLDGGLNASSLAFQTAGNTSNTASLAAAFGARSDGTTEFLSMDLYEVLIYPRVLTSIERAIVEDYLENGSPRTFNLFSGLTDDAPINPDVETKTAAVALVDGLAYFRGINISTPLYQGIFAGEAIGFILDAAGWPTSRRRLDRGSTVIPFFWEDGEDALTALDKVLRSEGSPAMLYMGTDGEVVFRDRHHRLVDFDSIASQATWNTVAGAEPQMNVPFEYDEAWRNIINHGQLSVDVRALQPLEEVWVLDSPIGFGASEVKTFIAQASDPFRSAVTPTAGTDYVVTTGSITSVTLSRTSGASTTITVTAGGGGAQINRLALRAQPVRVAYSVQVTGADATSTADYGQRSFPHDLPWCNQYDAQAILDQAIQQRAQPLPIVSVTFLVAQDVARSVAILSRNLSDRITIVEPETALNGDFYLETIGHDATAEFDHFVYIGLEALPPAGPVTASNVFLIGGGVGHQIGDGVLA